MIKVNVKHYKTSLGVAPRGQGNWFFKIGNELISIPGMYSLSKGKAIQMAKEKGKYQVIVMP